MVGKQATVHRGTTDRAMDLAQDRTAIGLASKELPRYMSNPKEKKLDGSEEACNILYSERKVCCGL